MYAADGGVYNTLVDIAHKIVSPSTYSCNLCAITYGIFTENKAWKSFVRDLSIPVEFLHRDDFLKKYPLNKEVLPAIFSDFGQGLALTVSAKRINQMKSVEELITEVKNLLEKGK